MFKKDLDTELKCLSDLADGAIRVRAAVLFGVAGGALGAVIGVIVGRERWEEVARDRIRVSVAPQPNAGIALAASIRF